MQMKKVSYRKRLERMGEGLAGDPRIYSPLVKAIGNMSLGEYFAGDNDSLAIVVEAGFHASGYDGEMRELTVAETAAAIDRQMARSPHCRTSLLQAAACFALPLVEESERRKKIALANTRGKPSEAARNKCGQSNPRCKSVKQAPLAKRMAAMQSGRNELFGALLDLRFGEYLEAFEGESSFEDIAAARKRLAIEWAEPDFTIAMVATIVKNRRDSLQASNGAYPLKRRPKRAGSMGGGAGENPKRYPHELVEVFFIRPFASLYEPARLGSESRAAEKSQAHRLHERRGSLEGAAAIGHGESVLRDFAFQETAPLMLHDPDVLRRFKEAAREPLHSLAPHMCAFGFNAFSVAMLWSGRNANREIAEELTLLMLRPLCGFTRGFECEGAPPDTLEGLEEVANNAVRMGRLFGLVPEGDEEWARKLYSFLFMSEELLAALCRRLRNAELFGFEAQGDLWIPDDPDSTFTYLHKRLGDLVRRCDELPKGEERSRCIKRLYQEFLAPFACFLQSEDCARWTPVKL